MKLVTHYVDPGEASGVCARLRAAGVMTEVDSVDPHIVRPSKSGALRVGLWVVFDDQFDDALQLLGNPDHVPQRRISLDEMNKIKSHGDEYSLRSGRECIEILATILFGICLLGLIAYTLYSSFG